MWTSESGNMFAVRIVVRRLFYAKGVSIVAAVKRILLTREKRKYLVLPYMQPVFFSYQHMLYRYMLAVKVYDKNEFMTCVLFDVAATPLLGFTVDQLVKMSLSEVYMYILI